eukprot:445044_1
MSRRTETPEGSQTASNYPTLSDGDSTGSPDPGSHHIVSIEDPGSRGITTEDPGSQVSTADLVSPRPSITEGLEANYFTATGEPECHSQPTTTDVEGSQQFFRKLSKLNPLPIIKTWRQSFAGQSSAAQPEDQRSVSHHPEGPLGSEIPSQTTDLPESPPGGEGRCARFRRLKISVAALLLTVLVLFGVAALAWFLIMNGHVYNLSIFSDVDNSEPSGAAMPWELFSKVVNRAPPADNVFMSQWALARALTSLEVGLTGEAKQEVTDFRASTYKDLDWVIYDARKMGISSIIQENRIAVSEGMTVPFQKLAKAESGMTISSYDEKSADSVMSQAHVLKAWVEQSTGGVIKPDLKSFVEHHLPAGGATLFTSLYFRTTWKEPLTGGSGACMNFTALAADPKGSGSGGGPAEKGGGDKARDGPQLMQAVKLSGTEFVIFDNNFIAMRKKMRAAHFSVTFIMPHERTPLLKFIDNFTDAKWAKLLDIFDHCDDSTLCVERLVWLPRAKMVTKNLKLRDILEDMGVRRAFNVTDEVNMTDKPVKVAEVFQNAVFSYDDTKSKTIQNLNDVADSFGNIIDGIGEMFAEKPQKPPTRPVRFDRPFWVVVHYMDSVLMSGVVNQPDQCE